MRAIPFSEVIFDATGKKVIAVDKNNETDQRVIKQIGDVLDEVLRRMNAPDSPIQNIPRINEVSSHFEDMMRELLNATPGLSCDVPRTAENRVQRSGYPDLRLVDTETKRVFYLDPKLYAVGSRAKQFSHVLFRTEDARRTKCSMMRCISLSVLNTRSASADGLEIYPLGFGRSRAVQSEIESGVPGK